MKQSLKILIIAGVIVLGAALFFFYRYQSVLSAKLDIQVAPENSAITLNGKPVSAGNYRLKPGNYTVKAVYNGFSPASQNTSLKKGDSKFSGLVLDPDSPQTANWYQSHPSDQRLAESISGRNFDLTASEQLSRLPLIKDLPFVDQFFRVDYGVSKAHPTDPSAVALYIKYYSAAGKQQALDWLKFKGYDPSKLEIIYTYASAQ